MEDTLKITEIKSPADGFNLGYHVGKIFDADKQSQAKIDQMVKDHPDNAIVLAVQSGFMEYAFEKSQKLKKQKIAELSKISEQKAKNKDKGLER